MTVHFEPYLGLLAEAGGLKKKNMNGPFTQGRGVGWPADK